MAAIDITLLGTGSPLPSGNRCGGGQLVVSGDDAVLIDCGWGVARKLITAGYPLANINHAFFTHMHSDHITDLPDLLMMRWTLGGATQPLTIYGPEGTCKMAESFHAGLEPDIGYRFAHHGEKLSRDGITIDVHEVPATEEPRNVADVGGIRVESFEVDHRPVVPALGFRVQAHGKTVVFSGDTRRCQALVDASRGADVLISEAVHLGMMQDRINLARSRDNERIAGILEDACDYHAPTMDVAEMARDAGVPRLVITHLIPPIADEGPDVARFIEGMRDVYTGEIEVGRDMQRISVE